MVPTTTVSTRASMTAAFTCHVPEMTRDESVDTASYDWYPLPDINDDDEFRSVIKKLSIYFDSAIELPSTFEQLRTTPAGACLRDLANHLAETCQNPLIVNALL
ncbi:hypothetical protein G3M48_004914, partial [Beauveria asiatica]